MKVLGGSDVLPSPLAGEGLGERGRPCPRRGQQSRLTALAMCFRKDSTNSCATMAPLYASFCGFSFVQERR